MAEVTPEVVTPVETPVAAPEATQLPASTADQVESPEGQEPAAIEPEKTLTQSEVNKLVAREKAKEAKRVERAIRAEAERDLLLRQAEARDRPVAPQPQGKPQQKDFSDWESFHEALTDWKVEQRLGKLREETTAQQQERQAQESERQFARTINENFKAAAEKYPDFIDVVTADGLPFYQGSPMLAYLAKSKAAGEIAYHLGNDRAEADRIAQLHPIDQVFALRDLEAKLTAPPKPTQTPAPIVPASPRPSTEKKLEDAEGYDEFNAIRRKQIAARRR